MKAMLAVGCMEQYLVSGGLVSQPRGSARDRHCSSAGTATRWATGGLQCLVASTLRRTGLEGCRSPGAMVHALRHTFATKLAENGATATEIMNLLGHASLSTSQTCIDATGGEQRAAAAANPVYRDLTASLNADG